MLLRERLEGEPSMKINRILPAVAILTLPLMIFSISTSAQSVANAPAMRTIEVDGSGEARTSPDTADLDLAIDTQAKNCRGSRQPQRRAGRESDRRAQGQTRRQGARLRPAAMR